MEQEYTTQKGIGFDTLWTVAKRCVVWMLIAAVVMGTVAFVASFITTPVTYTVKTEYLVHTTSTNTGSIAEDMVEVVITENATRYVMESYDPKTEFTDAEIHKANKMLSANQKGNSLIVLTFTGRDKDTVVHVALAYEKYLSEYVSTQMYAGRNVSLRTSENCKTDPNGARNGLLRDTVVAGAVGALLVYCVFFVLYLMDKRVRGEETLKENFAETDILATIPSAVQGMADESAVAEAYRSLRIKLSYAAGSTEGCNVIAVTGTREGEGKTTVAMSLAASYAKLGKKVLVMEADLRNPSMAELLNLKTLKEKEATEVVTEGVEGEHTEELQETVVPMGLADYLSGEAALKDCVSCGVQENLDVLTAGHVFADAVDLFTSEKMMKAVKELRESYDVILVDLPAMTQVGDAAMLAPLLDGYMLVARVAYTNVKELKAAHEDMDRLAMRNYGFVLMGAN